MNPWTEELMNQLMQTLNAWTNESINDWVMQTLNGSIDDLK